VIYLVPLFAECAKLARVLDVMTFMVLILPTCFHGAFFCKLVVLYFLCWYVKTVHTTCFQQVYVVTSKFFCFMR
jgi:hypothetical protein